MTITTPAGRTIQLCYETAGAIEQAGMPHDIIDSDIDGLRDGTVAIADLIYSCYMADVDDAGVWQTWEGYVHACQRIADAERGQA